MTQGSLLISLSYWRSGISWAYLIGDVAYEGYKSRREFTGNLVFLFAVLTLLLPSARNRLQPRE